MKTYFVGNVYDGCYYVRCYLPMLYNGWNGTKIVMRGEHKDLKEVAKELPQYDTIVFQRPDCENKLMVAKMLKQLGKKIVFDNDDTLKDVEVDAMRLQVNLNKKNEVIDEFIKISDLVTTSTDFLAEEYRKLNNNVVVLPNMVDEFDWDEPLKNWSKKIRVGIVGSTATNGDYRAIMGVLEWLNKRNDVQMVMFGLPPKVEETKMVQEVYKKEFEFWQKLNIEWQPFVAMSDYFTKLNELRLDIMLIPRLDNYFNRCKSNIKFLEASMLEIPVIAQGFTDGLSPYQKDITDKTGRIAITESNWKIHLEELIKNKELRQSIGSNAKEYVLENYNIIKRSHLWSEAYEKI